MNEPLDVAMAELRLIPRGSLAQNLFRSVYLCLRQNSLGSKPEVAANPRAVLDAATALIRRTFPSFSPEHDPALIAGS